MVDKTTFIIYMISTTIAIIVLGSMCIKNIKRDIELLELINKIDEKHTANGNLLSEIINKIKR